MFLSWCQACDGARLKFPPAPGADTPPQCLLPVRSCSSLPRLFPVHDSMSFCPPREELNLAVLHAFVDLHEFTDLNLVQALR